MDALTGTTIFIPICITSFILFRLCLRYWINPPTGDYRIIETHNPLEKSTTWYIEQKFKTTGWHNIYNPFATYVESDGIRYRYFYYDEAKRYYDFITGKKTITTKVLVTTEKIS